MMAIEGVNRLVGLLLLAAQTKLILRWVYYWQLKEYRWDQMAVEMRSPVWRDRLIPTRKLYRPEMTRKAMLVLGLSLALGWTGLLVPLAASQVWLSGLVVLISPILVGLAIGLLLPVDYWLKGRVISRARRKLTGMNGLIVVGITGSYGKTSTKEILATLLREKYRVLATPKNYNTLVGVAETVNRQLKPSHQIYIVEMGAYKRGEIRDICRLVKPQVGILTGLSNQHLALFGSLKNLFEAKSELAAALPEDGLMVLNADKPVEWRMRAKTKAKVRPFSRLTTSQSDILNQLYIPISNAQAAITAAKYLGLNQGQINAGLAKLRRAKLSRRLDIVKTKRGYTVIFDDYNSNYVGFSYALEGLKKYPGRRKFVLSSGVRELGTVATEVHQKLADRMIGWVDELIVTQPGYLDLFAKPGLAARDVSAQGVIKWLRENRLGRGDVILVEGRQTKELRKLLMA